DKIAIIRKHSADAVAGIQIVVGAETEIVAGIVAAGIELISEQIHAIARAGVVGGQRNSLNQSQSSRVNGIRVVIGQIQQVLSHGTADRIAVSIERLIGEW